MCRIILSEQERKIEDIGSEIGAAFFDNTNLSRAYAESLGRRVAASIYAAHVKPMEYALATAQSMCRTAHDVARIAWGGEIPSPLPGHTHMTEEEFCEKYNCPWCGGSGHVDDCDEADRLVKAKLAKAEADKAALVEALEGCVRMMQNCDCQMFSSSPMAMEKAHAALARVKGEA